MTLIPISFTTSPMTFISYSFVLSTSQKGSQKQESLMINTKWCEFVVYPTYILFIQSRYPVLYKSVSYSADSPVTILIKILAS